jgi:hypothetical protein
MSRATSKPAPTWLTPKLSNNFEPAGVFFEKASK